MILQPDDSCYAYVTAFRKFVLSDKFGETVAGIDAAAKGDGRRKQTIEAQEKLKLIDKALNAIAELVWLFGFETVKDLFKEE